MKENAAVYLPSGFILRLNFCHPCSQSVLNPSSSFQDYWSLLWIYVVALLVSLSFMSCSWPYQGSLHSLVHGVWVIGSVLELQAKLWEENPGTGLIFSEHLAKPFCLLRDMCYCTLIQWKSKGTTMMCQKMSPSPEKLQKILMSSRKHYRSNFLLKYLDIISKRAVQIYKHNLQHCNQTGTISGCIKGGLHQLSPARSQQFLKDKERDIKIPFPSWHSLFHLHSLSFHSPWIYGFAHIVWSSILSLRCCSDCPERN